MELKDWVKAARAKSGYTLEQIGEAVGRTKANVHGWEKGLQKPSVSQFLKVASITRMNPAELDDWPAEFGVLPRAADDEPTEGGTMNGWPLSPELLAALQNATPEQREILEDQGRALLRMKRRAGLEESDDESA